MRKLYLHVGLPKCGSTSLQKGLMNAPNILFPNSGNHGGEHLAFALTIRGLDSWTRQFFDEAWVEREQSNLYGELNKTQAPVVISSERLAAMTNAEIEKVSELFPGFEIHIIICRRDYKSYMSSIWRHAVFRHDYGENYETLLEHLKNFNFDDVETKFQIFFPTHTFTIEDDNYAESIGALIGTKIELPRVNVGVPFELAKLLQQTHILLGSEEFKKKFDQKTKNQMLAVWNKHSNVTIEPMTAPLF